MKKNSLLWGSLLAFAATLLISVLMAPINAQSSEGLFRFLGRFHVLMLHFPVVLLLLAPGLELLSNKIKYHSLKEHLPLIWWLGALSAFATVSLGLMLAANEGYAFDEVKTHLIGGVSVALLALLCTGLRCTLSAAQNKIIQSSYIACTLTLIVTMIYTAHAGGNLVHGETYLTRFAPEPLRSWVYTEEKRFDLTHVDDKQFTETVQPLLQTYCVDCHGPDTQKAGLRLDTLNPNMLTGNDAPHWHSALDMINSGEMPPAKKKQPSNEERKLIVDWMTQGITLAKEAKKGQSERIIPRLTKQQYTNTLKDLLGLDINFGDVLPNDPLSESGFSNNGELLASSPLHLEYFQNIARDALSKAIVTKDKPQTYHYRVRFAQGKGTKGPHFLSEGYMDIGLEPNDFIVEILDEAGKIRTDAEAETLKQYFSVSLRGSAKNRFHLKEDGITLYSAIPHIEKTQDGKYGAWNGPSPNIAMQVGKIFPTEGRFIVRVKASQAQRFDQRLDNVVRYIRKKAIARWENNTLITPSHDQSTVLSVQTLPQAARNHFTANPARPGFFQLKRTQQKYTTLNFTPKLKGSGRGYYQIDILHTELPNDQRTSILLKFNDAAESISFRGVPGSTGKAIVTSIAGAYLDADKPYNLKVKIDNNFPEISSIIVTRVDDHKKLIKKLTPTPFIDANYKTKTPSLIPYIGSRTDDGMDYKHFANSVEITANKNTPQIYSFQGQLENLPVPPTDASGNFQNSGNLKIGLWNNHFVKSKNHSGPPVHIEYIEFEAPYFEQWPPQSHTAIFIDSKNKHNERQYAREVISHFAERAFRRPLLTHEMDPYIQLWEDIKNDFPSFEQGIQETLVAVLSSSNFLFLAEPTDQMVAQNSGKNSTNTVAKLLGVTPVSAKARHQNLADFALASRLSYFLWNSPPDQELLNIAASGRLQKEIEQQLERMVNDAKFDRFIRVFASEWLRLDRHQKLSVDVDTYPDYTRFVKRDMRSETEHFLKEIIRNNLSINNLIDSDFAMLNQNLAEFYGIPGVEGNQFRPVPLTSNQPRGGLLAQGAFLTGHSDGLHGHPIKRAVWLKEKILGDTPPPPPPNVPEIDPETPGFENLTLKQQLELHRDKDSCRDCHAKIDPFGVVFENYDAVGRFRNRYKGNTIDVASTLPDGTKVSGISAMKQYLTSNKQDAVAKSLVTHLYAYALSKEVSFHDEDTIAAILTTAKNQHYGAKAVLKALVTSPPFLGSTIGEKQP